jgi:cysteinyl-tRNA synthetase
LAGLLQALGGVLGLLQPTRRPTCRPAAQRRGPGRSGDQQQIAERARPRQPGTLPRPTASGRLLLAQGVVLKDGPAGTTWERA